MRNLDRFIANMPAERDGDLMLCREHGLAYQRDRNHIISYDDEYYNRCKSYEGQAIANRINAGRLALVSRHIGNNRLCDVGIGSGEFIRSRPNTFGRDINPVAQEWLKRSDLWLEHFNDCSNFSFWDVLEHLPDPEQYLRHVPLHGFVFCCLPLFYGLGAIRLSKHYRPGEHLYYWSEGGFIEWMGLHGFQKLERCDFEIAAGRESIYSFAFKRILDRNIG